MMANMKSNRHKVEVEGQAEQQVVELPLQAMEAHDAEDTGANLKELTERRFLSSSKVLEMQPDSRRASALAKDHPEPKVTDASPVNMSRLNNSSKAENKINDDMKDVKSDEATVNIEGKTITKR